MLFVSLFIFLFYLLHSTILTRACFIWWSREEQLLLKEKAFCSVRSEYGLWISIIAMYYMCNASGHSDSVRVPRKCVIVYAHSQFTLRLVPIFSFHSSVRLVPLRYFEICVKERRDKVLDNEKWFILIEHRRRFIFSFSVLKIFLGKSKLFYSRISKLFIFIEKYL